MAQECKDTIFVSFKFNRAHKNMWKIEYRGGKRCFVKSVSVDI